MSDNYATLRRNDAILGTPINRIRLDNPSLNKSGNEKYGLNDMSRSHPTLQPLGLGGSTFIHINESKKHHRPRASSGASSSPYSLPALSHRQSASAYPLPSLAHPLPAPTYPLPAPAYMPYPSRESMQSPSMQGGYSSGKNSPTDTLINTTAAAAAASLSGYDKSMSSHKRSRNAWPADKTRQIMNVLLDEFLVDPSFRTTIYRSREERDHRFIPSGRSILQEYNKIQNLRRRFFIPLSYLLQWDQLRNMPLSSVSGTVDSRSRQKLGIEKKMSKELELKRLKLIFGMQDRNSSSSSSSSFSSSSSLSGMGDEQESDNEQEQEADTDNRKPVFELDIFVTELKLRDPLLWARGYAAFQLWTSRKSSINFILNH
ncbi:hypothetical protein LPJ66_000292 [Kickxella alabastrina]|uniref:Uncharacterized protein n=1 Tax=Kickxella alabastrina TaxID=61397 RepID=A0ACC1IWK5_9FUNG|nr:hypothetical protein LPJ66_000292 [Kickxella alabastrina]